MNKSIWGNTKGLPEKGNKTIGREGEAGGNDDDNKVYSACKTKGMRHLGGTVRAATRAGGAAWGGGIAWARAALRAGEAVWMGEAARAGAVTRAGVPWEQAVPLLRMLVHWWRLSVHRALHVCRIAPLHHTGHHQRHACGLARLCAGL